MAIEIIGGEVVARGKAKGTKRAEEDTPTNRTKGKRDTAADIEMESAANGGAPHPAPSRRGRKKTANPAPVEPISLNAVTPGHDAKLPEEPAKPTLADLAAGYIAHLETTGKSAGTVVSYCLELAVAMDELGKDTAVRELTAERVKGFFESDRVTETRSGRSKSPLSIAKTRRVLRQAIAWSVEGGMVEAGVVPVG